MADRDVAGAVGRRREADPGKPGDHAIDAVGLGIERDIALRSSPRRSSGRAPLRRSPSRTSTGRPRSARPARRPRGFGSIAAMTPLMPPPLLLRPSALGPPPSSRLRSALNPCSARNSRSGSSRNALQRQGVERLGQLGIADQPHQLARQSGIVGMVDQRLLELGFGDLVGAGEHGFEIAELLDQLGGGLRADPRNARHIVDAVAHQRQDVADLVGAARRTSR